MKFISKFYKRFKSKISCVIEKLRQIVAKKSLVKQKSSINTKIVSKNGQTRADLINF